MNKYEVKAKCGHVGRNYYVVKSFPIEANSGKEAAALIRLFPRVKHDKKDAILSVVRIDEGRFNELRRICANDPYFRCRNRQEQNLFCHDLEIYRESYEDRDRNVSKETGEARMYHKQKIRNYKKYIIRYVPGWESDA